MEGGKGRQRKGWFCLFAVLVMVRLVSASLQAVADSEPLISSSEPISRSPRPLALPPVVMAETASSTDGAPARSAMMLQTQASRPEDSRTRSRSSGVGGRVSSVGHGMLKIDIWKPRAGEVEDRRPRLRRLSRHTCTMRSQPRRVGDILGAWPSEEQPPMLQVPPSKG